MVPREVRTGLYLGGTEALDSITNLAITHVLSVLNNHSDVSAQVQKLLLTHMVIDICDDEQANLLLHLEQAVQFIQTALAANGRVLVHCQAGVSRSASVVVAYLMAVESLDANTALVSLQSIYPEAAPNAAFLQQLQLWHEMKCSFDARHPGYSKLNMQQLAEQHFAGQQVEPNNLPAPSQNEQGQVYRCRKCRRLVASQSNVVAVKEGARSMAFKHKHRAKQFGKQTEDAGSLWVEPLQWMEELSEGCTQGKLYCPSCKTRLGSYNWAGSQSESGAWVTPAFQLHHSKIDAMSAQAAVPLGIRRPLFGGVSQQASSAEAVSQNSGALQMSPPNQDLPPLDATRTLSEAGHVAAQIDSELERPGAVPST